ncbi:hypothetical protein BU14_1784s0001 [Porphyra umbilicalis]|uniref:Peptidase S8/S53 domain-containing protein n=1 Tax=Porphyra umbilicalis TaxID=2786 RepID=A0A1X6NKK7_PORUM|nr:hypothetical protein BU14_1784s0001 [Porphyra umbilicalis]|eukprot:OSX69161.1 hypothetical protein BU14_1784s0001 [Porphyra umbilicalis]
MASNTDQVGATETPLLLSLPTLEYTSPEPGEAAERTFIRFATPKDDVEARPIFQGLDGAGVRVAVLDTGIDATHPALANRIDKEASRNFAGGDPKDYTDRQGHGTHCAGIIAAEDRGAIMSGIAPAATIIALKVLGDNGSGSQEGITRGIRYAIAQNADVISMSLGSGADDTAYERFRNSTADQYKAIQEALVAGIVVVIAAGNSGRRSDKNEINPPGAFGGVITVASHDDAGRRSNFSSRGGELDLMAPGETFSTYARGVPYRGRLGREYEQLRGTSMACPLVAGLAALLVQAGRARSTPPGLSPQLRTLFRRSAFRARNNYEVREVLRYFADRPHEHDRESGYGALSAVYTFVKGTVDESKLSVKGGAK